MLKPDAVAVIGAGMAGLACAQVLHEAGVTVTLFDKGRRPGGRVASRRQGDHVFDHGAPYATAQGEAFRGFLLHAGDRVTRWGPEDRWVGVPGMSTLAQVAVARGVGTLLTGRQVVYVARRQDGWHVRHQDAEQTRPGAVLDDGEHAGPFRRIVLAIPAPQAAGLLRAIGHRFADVVAAIGMEPCWAIMLGFAERNGDEDLPALSPQRPFSWLSRDSARPGRARLPDCWVGHAGAAWSRAHLEDAPESIVALLSSEFAAATGIATRPDTIAVHRWRYARATTALGRACLQDDDGLVVCGDWCLGHMIEDAYRSGLEAADAALAFNIS